MGFEFEDADVKFRYPDMKLVAGDFTRCRICDCDELE